MTETIRKPPLPSVHALLASGTVCIAVGGRFRSRRLAGGDDREQQSFADALQPTHPGTARFLDLEEFQIGIH